MSRVLVPVSHANVLLAAPSSTVSGELIEQLRVWEEMKSAITALQSGLLNEWRATLLVRETACLSVEDRAAVDEELAPDAGTFEGKGDKAIVAAVKAAAYRRDPRPVAGRASRAAAERTVSLRPAPDTMTYLTALLPVTRPAPAVTPVQVMLPVLVVLSRRVARSWPTLWWNGLRNRPSRMGKGTPGIGPSHGLKASNAGCGAHRLGTPALHSAGHGRTPRHGLQGPAF